MFSYFIRLLACPICMHAPKYQAPNFCRTHSSASFLLFRHASKRAFQPPYHENTPNARPGCRFWGRPQKTKATGFLFPGAARRPPPTARRPPLPRPRARRPRWACQARSTVASREGLAWTLKCSKVHGASLMPTAESAKRLSVAPFREDSALTTRSSPEQHKRVTTLIRP